MTFLAIVGSLVFALWNWPPRCVSLYLWAQLIYALTVFPVNHFWHDTSLVYTFVYVSATALVFAAIANIVLGAVRTRQNSWKAFGIVGVLSVTLGRLAVLGLAHPARYYDWIGIIEGCFLFAAALTLGAVAPYLERTDLALVLAGLWFAQAWFRIGFYLHLEEWGKWNWRVPPLLGIVGFVLVGAFSRRRFVRLVRSRGIP